jgi:mRNA-degrading endonuclease RelE of RelBE toxin-antitoxin system
VEIRTTEIFEKSLAKLYKQDKLLLDTLEELVTELKETPTLGTNLGNNRYKIRVRNRGSNKSKRGGYRVITYTKIENTILLVYIYSKSKTENVMENRIDEVIANYLVSTDG